MGVCRVPRSCSRNTGRAAVGTFRSGSDEATESQSTTLEAADIGHQHCAILVSDTEFDAALSEFKVRASNSMRTMTATDVAKSKSTTCTVPSRRFVKQPVQP